MKGTHIGEFQEIVLLAIAILDENAYSISIGGEIQKKTKRKPSIGALHSALSRLEEKGFIDSREGDETPERGGRRKRFYTIKAAGIKALKNSRELRNTMWDAIPNLSLGLKRS